jgi:hypothetical protein
MLISFDINTYKTRFLGGARQYLFFVLLQFPGTTMDYNSSSLLTSFGKGSQSDLFPYLVRTTSLPDSSFEEIPNVWQGHAFKMAGARNYGDWQLSFNIDEQGRILDRFNAWHNMIYDPVSQSYNEPKTYMVDQQLFLIDGNGEATKEYKLIKAWPKAISQTSLDYASTDLATVDVTFSYQYYTNPTENIQSSGTQSLLKSVFNRLIS